jgi:UDP-N-acetylmuramyl-tripeptide synthetase
VDSPRLPLGDYWQLLLRHNLVSAAAAFRADLSRTVPLVSCDSRAVIPGTLFLCKGAAFHSGYLRQAAERGAVAYVSEVPYPDVPELPCILVSDIRRAMALLADRAWGHPSGAVSITGITGTKGKTTAAYLLKSILDFWRQSHGQTPTAILSTIMTDDGLERRPAKLTTPEPLDLQRHLWNAVNAGKGFVTMEVSSQALKYHRVTGVDFATAVFLNIGEDHISPIEHPDFEDYFSSKLMIFRQAGSACVNLDSDFSGRVLDAARVCPQVITFSRTDSRAHVFADQIHLQAGVISFRVRTPRYTQEMALPMSGIFNVDNALAAIAAAEGYGVDEAAVREGLRRVYVPGRMETYVSADGAITVIVDYAHNGMSLEAVLASARSEYPDRQLTVLFGCTGGKALDRREGMGNAAGRWADRILLTEDDPGPEGVVAICEDIGLSIAPHGKAWTMIPDREQAIAAAILEAQRPAVVVLAGKGAEQTQKRKNGPEPCAPDGMLAQKILGKYDMR